jgi:membrane dipeptidase
MRLIDLHCNWLRQYFSELTSFDRSSNGPVAHDFRQLDGYLSTTSAAGLICARSADDWAALAEPWAMLHEMIVRYQAEFSGRILMGPDDADRWNQEPADGLCWGLIGVQGFDFLIRTQDDLDRLPELFARGVRMFQPIETSRTSLGGSSEPGDDRGLTDIGRQFLERLAGLTPDHAASSPRPILDLAGMNSATVADVLGWLEADPARPGRVLVVVSHGPIGLPESIESVTRLRRLGGVIGLGVGSPSVNSTDDLTAQFRAIEAIPFQGGDGSGGIAIGTRFLGDSQPLAELNHVGLIIKWVRRHFDKPTADALLFGNGRELYLKAVGGKP